MTDIDPLPTSDAQRLSAMVWGGELRKAEDELRRLPADSPRVALLFGQAAFVEAVLTGDGDVAGDPKEESDGESDSEESEADNDDGVVEDHTAE